MKKQTNPSIKAHLLWSALILLTLVAVCAIPFALGQRQAVKRSVINPAAKIDTAANQYMQEVTQRADGAVSDQPVPKISQTEQSQQLPTASGGAIGVGVLRILPNPDLPQIVLYDQYDSASPNHTRSSTFTDFPTFGSDLADDFVVPAGQTWNVQSIDADGGYFKGPGPATDWNVFIYTDSSNLPGTQIFSALNQPVSVVGTTFTVNLPTPAVLTAGTYWIEIQANMTFGTQGEWDWTDRMMQANSGAAFRNPGGDVGCGTDWIRKIFCVASMDPDQVYRLNGTIGGPIELQARVQTQGNNHKVQLRWSPADGGSVNVLRNGVVRGTTADDGKATDNLGTHTGTFTYQVCETDTGDCSNEVTVQVP